MEIGRPEGAGLRSLEQPSVFLVDHVIVAVHLPSDQLIGQPGNGGDHDTLAPATHRIGGEQNAGRPRLDHALHNHCGGAAIGIEPTGTAIGPHGFAEAGAPDLHGALPNLGLSHIEHREELAGMGMAGAVLFAPGGANGEGSFAQRVHGLSQSGRGGAFEAGITKGLGLHGDERRYVEAHLGQTGQGRRLAAEVGDIHPCALGADHFAHATASPSNGAKPAAA